MGSQRSSLRSWQIWVPASAALLLAAATVLLIWVVTVPAGPPQGCAWGGPCTLDARGAVVSGVVGVLAAATALGFVLGLRWARWAATAGLLVLLGAPLWAQIAVRGHAWGSLPL